MRGMLPTTTTKRKTFHVPRSWLQFMCFFSLDMKYLMFFGCQKLLRFVARCFKSIRGKESPDRVCDDAQNVSKADGKSETASQSQLGPSKGLSALMKGLRVRSRNDSTELDDEQRSHSRNPRRGLLDVTEELIDLLAEARADRSDELSRAELLLAAALRTSWAWRDGQLATSGMPGMAESAGADASSDARGSRPNASMPRSRALSRASSYDSFFDGEGVRFVLASPENTQPSTPRSQSQQTSQMPWPTMPSRCVLPEPYWMMDEQSTAQIGQANLARWNETGINPAGFESTGRLGIFEERSDLQNMANLPNGWREAVSPHALVLQRAPVHKRRGSKGSKASVDSESQSQLTQEELQELRHVAASTSMRKRPQSSIPGPSLGMMWHNSPFAISRTPNIHTPASHRSPARSPTSFSGYCSPIPGFHSSVSSGVASPQRRSGYSSPSTTSGAFFGAAQSGLMRRLMSLREATRKQRKRNYKDMPRRV